MAAPEDVAWAAAVARLTADAEMPAEARELADEVLGIAGDVQALAVLVRGLAKGEATAERVASALALDNFDLGAESAEFLAAAAEAAMWEPNPELARKILDVPDNPSLAGATLINVLITADRHEEAAKLLLDLLAEADPEDHSELIEDHGEQWASVTARRPELRRALRSRNPMIARSLEIARDSK